MDFLKGKKKKEEKEAPKEKLEEELTEEQMLARLKSIKDGKPYQEPEVKPKAQTPSGGSEVEDYIGEYSRRHGIIAELDKPLLRERQLNVLLGELRARVSELEGMCFLLESKLDAKKAEVEALKVEKRKELDELGSRLDKLRGIYLKDGE